ncbi:MAG: DUF2784 domain-containing protein [Desulfobacterales bacterium]|uniref:DUF2784 domain-containing protein n=1 Tax=Candidatus Desulfatibia vada TaxID=2841696 RepID=A0A8J6NQE8_9BACT|nr:DUF2784 domain-containing protein [Candidatus Desulfatibia vada]
MYSALADIAVLLHFIYVIFSVAGGILCIWRPKIIWLHLPAALWAALISFGGWICPLTYLENWLRIKGGNTVYGQGFIVKHLEPVLYPAGLTQCRQVALGIIVIVLNLAVYGYVLRLAGWFSLKGKEV